MAETMVQRAGGVVRSDSAIDLAGRVARKLDFARERQEWYNSAKGITEASAEALTVLDEVTNLGRQIKSDYPGLGIRVESRNTNFFVATNRYGLAMFWDRESSITSLRGFALNAALYQGYVRFPEGISASKPPKEIEAYQFDPEIDRSFKPGWRERGREKKFFTSKQVADMLVRRLLELIESN